MTLSTGKSFLTLNLQPRIHDRDSSNKIIPYVIINITNAGSSISFSPIEKSHF